MLLIHHGFVSLCKLKVQAARLLEATVSVWVSHISRRKQASDNGALRGWLAAIEVSNQRGACMLDKKQPSEAVAVGV